MQFEPPTESYALEALEAMSKLSALLRSWRSQPMSSTSAVSHVGSPIQSGKYAHGAIGQVCKGTQILLMQRYQELRRIAAPLPAFADVEFRNYSQNGEDGILLYLFSLIGMTDRRCVEICAGDGIECNAANLILNHGFSALLVDGDERNVAVAKEFYERHRDTFAFTPSVVQRWIDRDTVDDLLRQQSLTGEIDLLTIDIDGNDYWIWQAIECVSPRVVVVEYDNSWGADESVSMQYDPTFVFRLSEPGMPHCGASLAAFVSLARQKGYRLVGSQLRCFNAFFLRDDVGRDVFPEVSVESCLTDRMHAFRKSIRLSRPDSPLLKRWVRV